MATYVYSLRVGSRLAHIGNEARTACGHVFTSAFMVADEVPADRHVCATCAAKVGARAEAGAARANSDLARDAIVVALLKEGLDNAGISRRLRVGLRTTVRYVNDAMTRAGARSRFQWGYLVGLAEGGV